MRTKDLEEELGLTKHTIHYYEKEGFIHPKRDENGYRNYSHEDVQILQLVKFLRNLNISIDDVKSILTGELSFHECLKVNQVHLDKQIESMKEVKKTIDTYYDKDLPFIPELAKIEVSESKNYFGFQKTTETVSLGRKLTKPWAIRQMLYAIMPAIFIGYGMGRFFFSSDTSIYISVLTYITLSVIVFLLLLASAFKQTSTLMLDNSMDQSIEFIRDGIRYYQFKGFIRNLKYFMAVLFGKDEQMMCYCRYEDIQQVEVIAKKRYMKIGTPFAYAVYIADFRFEFNDGTSFYFLWPMTLDDDARYIAYILETKIKNIKDTQNILYAMKNGINLNDYLIAQ